MTDIGYRRRLVALVALILALGGVYAFAMIRGAGKGGASTALLPGLDPQRVSAVALSAPDRSPVKLEKTGTAWLVEVGARSFPANGIRVAALLEGLVALRAGKTMSRDPGLRARFGLDPPVAGRVKVEAAGGSLLADILVGKREPGGSEDFLALGASVEVHLTRSALSFYLSQEGAYWYDLSVLPYDVTGPRISQISVSGDLPSGGGAYSNVGYRLVRGEGNTQDWQVAGGGPELDQLKVDSVANSLASLQGVDLLERAPQASAEARQLRVVVVTEAGARYGLRAQPVGDGRQLLVIRDGSGYLYLVNAAALRRAVLPLRELERSGG